MRRPLVWLQLLIGWFPVWALYTVLVVTAHPQSDPVRAAWAGFRAVAAAAALGVGVGRLTQRLPWPRPVRLGFVVVHLAAAAGYAVSWVGLVSLIESLLRGRLVLITTPNGVVPFFVLGVWLYVMVAGIAYATGATDRAARAEAAAARAELAALRSQLNPHFLFNTLHTVVQLIPREPARAARAAEQLAGLLRVTLERDRDLIALGEEFAFVDRYLELEHLRFGDRLTVNRNLAPDVHRAEIPAFAVQTLVENAIRHGAEPNVGPTEITLTARRDRATVVVTVSDTGGARPPTAAPGPGTGLRRLRDRLQVLYGTAASLEAEARPPGFVATLTVPDDAG